MTTHTNCTHPATKADRAACRKGRVAKPSAANLGLEMMPTAKAAKAEAVKPAEALIASIAYETVTCDRCAGSGTYPSAAWQGVCLKCSGKGNMLTRNGRAAYKKYEAYLAANHTKLAIDLQPGDDIRKMGRWVRVHDVDTTIRNHGGHTTIGSGDNAVSFCSIFINYTTRLADGTTVLNGVGPYDTMIVRPRGEAQQLAFRHVANMKGCIVTLHEG
jgi:DnaJ-class molecular chaperone